MSNVPLEEDVIATKTRNYGNQKEEPEVQQDTVKSRLERIKKVVVSGVGFLSDAYDLFIINIVMVILSARDEPNIDKGLVSSAALIGAIVGQLGFGILADRIGRKKGFIATLSLVIGGAILSCFSFKEGLITVSISLAFFRFVLGVGIGGEYPLSATITSESAQTSNRGRMVSLVFSMQGVGSLLASVTGYVLVISLGTDYDLMWRLALGIGAIPGILSLYFRITMEETGRFLTSRHERNEKFFDSFKTYWLTLLGTAGTWFLLDVTFYANGLFSATVIELLQDGKETFDTPTELANIALFNVYLALMALPGYWFGVLLIEGRYSGRKNTQLFGFIALSFNYAIMGYIFEDLKKMPALFLVLYGLTFFITNAGPNTTTFVLPSESFPTRIRATYHGISAASGKAGAALGAIAMAWILESSGLEIVLYCCAVVAMCGALMTVACTTETRGKSLEEIEREHVAAKPWWYYLPWSTERRIQYDLLTQNQSKPDQDTTA